MCPVANKFIKELNLYVVPSEQTLKDVTMQWAEFFV